MPTSRHDQYERSVLEKSTDTFVSIKKRASDLLYLYQSLGIPLNPQCSLYGLINSSFDIARDQQTGIAIDDDRIDDIIKGQTLARILDAARTLQENELSHIKEFRRGCLDPWKRAPSKAKDKLWELELLTILRNHGIEASLDEPDIVINLPSGKLGIACKRVYSEKNSEKSMSYGIKQISGSKIHGILAVNIDDIAIPKEGLLVAPNIESAQKELNKINENFAGRHEKKLEEYVSGSRAAAILISAWAPLYLQDNGISTCRQILVWSHPNSCDESRKMITEFESHFYR